MSFTERGNDEMKEFKAIIDILSLIPFEFLGIFTDYQTIVLLCFFMKTYFHFTYIYCSGFLTLY